MHFLVFSLSFTIFSLALAGEVRGLPAPRSQVVEASQKSSGGVGHLTVSPDAGDPSSRERRDDPSLREGRDDDGRVSKWLKESDCKSDVLCGFVGSNPTSPKDAYKFCSLDVVDCIDPLGRLGQCESNWGSMAVRGKAGEVGVFQWLPSTWGYLSKKADWTGDINSFYDQIWLTDWALKNNYGDLWSCYQKI